MPQPSPPSCPRCGYDQSGIVAGWTDRCPLQGRCSECGLDFYWEDVLRPDRHTLPWLYEHTPRNRVGLRRAWITWWRALRPWSFWELVHLRHIISIPRLLIWPFILLFSVHATASLVWVIAHGWLVHDYWSTTLDWRIVFSQEALVLYTHDIIDPLVRADERDPWLIQPSAARPVRDLARGLAAASAVAPILLLALPITRRRAKVRTGHILRAAIYGLAWLALLALLRLVDKAVLLLTIARDTSRYGEYWSEARRVTDTAVDPYIELWLVVGALWLAAYWHAVIRSLKLDQPGRTCTLVLAGSLLIGLLAYSASDRVMLQLMGGS